MKKILLFFFFTTAIWAQKTTELFPSKSLKATREISISLPPSYEKDSQKQYPVLYLLDGDYLFDPFYEIIVC